MTETPTISVVIASSNRITYLLDLLEDLSKQMMLPYEVIVVDQSDKPYNLENCVYIRDSGRGPCRARNIGAEIAKGEILVFLDDDVRIECDFLKEICEPIVSGKFAAVSGAICDAEGKYPRAAPCFRKNKHSDWLTAISANPEYAGEGLALVLPAGCCAILKRVFIEVGGFDLYFDPDGAGEDREIALRLFHYGYPVFYNGSARVMHLAASVGGRRSLYGAIVPAFTRIGPLEANMVYIVGKYFGDRVFSVYWKTWLCSSFASQLNWNPRSWLRSIVRCYAARQHIKNVKLLIDTSPAETRLVDGMSLRKEKNKSQFGKPAESSNSPAI